MGPVAHVVKDLAVGTSKVAMGVSGTLCAVACKPFDDETAGKFWSISQDLYKEGSKTAPLISEVRGAVEGIVDGDLVKVVTNTAFLAANCIPGGGTIGKLAGKSAASKVALKEASKGIAKSTAKEAAKQAAKSTTKNVTKKAASSTVKSFSKKAAGKALANGAKIAYDA